MLAMLSAAPLSVTGAAVRSTREQRGGMRPATHPLAPLRRTVASPRWRGVTAGLPENLAKDSVDLQSLRDKAGTCPPEGCLEDLLVKDLMDRNPITVRPDDSFLTALKILATEGITGIPVVGDDGSVEGMLSGYDLLCLDCTPGGMRKEAIFPSLDLDEMYDNPQTMWKEFTDRRDGIEKETARTVGGAMRNVTTIFEEASVDDAANLMVQKKIHRLAVVDRDDKFVGKLTRKMVLRATWNNFKWYLELED